MRAEGSELKPQPDVRARLAVGCGRHHLDAVAHITHRHIANDSVRHVLHINGNRFTAREGGAAGALAILNQGVLDHAELGLQAPLAVGVQERSPAAQTIQADGALFHHQFLDVGAVAVPVEALHARTGGEDDLRGGEGGGRIQGRSCPPGSAGSRAAPSGGQRVAGPRGGSGSQGLGSQTCTDRDVRVVAFLGESATKFQMGENAVSTNAALPHRTCDFPLGGHIRREIQMSIQ